MRALVTDPVDGLLIEGLARCGVEVDYRPNIAREELLRVVHGYDILVVRSRTKVTRDVLAQGAGRLKLVGVAGVGLDGVDLEAAEELGVKVVNAAGASTQSTAELTIGLMIAAARRVCELNAKARSGIWDKAMGLQLAGRTLLVVGLGRIGSRVAEIARAIGMNVLAYDIADVSERARRVGAKLAGSLCEGLREADVVSLHVTLNETSYRMINYDVLNRCFKRGSILVNTSRGAVVDPEAVLKALDEGILYAYATDVLVHEPPYSDPAEVKLLSHPRVVVTPHVGAQTPEAQRAVAIMLLERVREAVGLRC